MTVTIVSPVCGVRERGDDDGDDHGESAGETGAGGGDDTGGADDGPG